MEFSYIVKSIIDIHSENEGKDVYKLKDKNKFFLQKMKNTISKNIFVCF